MHVELKEEQQLVRNSIRRAMANILTPGYLRRIDEAGLYPYEAYDAWLKLGLLGRGVPEQYGGAGGDIEDVALISEDLARSWGLRLQHGV